MVVCVSSGRYLKGQCIAFLPLTLASVRGEEGNVYKQVRFAYLEFSKEKAQFYTLSSNRDSQAFFFSPFFFGF